MNQDRLKATRSFKKQNYSQDNDEEPIDMNLIERIHRSLNPSAKNSKEGRFKD